MELQSTERKEGKLSTSKKIPLGIYLQAAIGIAEEYQNSQKPILYIVYSSDQLPIGRGQLTCSKQQPVQKAEVTAERNAAALSKQINWF